MSPKQWIRYVKRIEKRGLAICDGVTTSTNLDFTVLYAFFLLTGSVIFLHILNWYTDKKETIKRKIEGRKAVEDYRRENNLMPAFVPPGPRSWLPALIMLIVAVIIFLILFTITLMIINDPSVTDPTNLTFYGGF